MPLYLIDETLASIARIILSTAFTSSSKPTRYEIRIRRSYYSESTAFLFSRYLKNARETITFDRKRVRYDTISVSFFKFVRFMINRFSTGVVDKLTRATRLYDGRDVFFFCLFFVIRPASFVYIAVPKLSGTRKHNIISRIPLTVGMLAENVQQQQNIIPDIIPKASGKILIE